MSDTVVERLRVCASCSTPKPRDSYYKDRRSPDGCKSRCKTCDEAAKRRNKKQKTARQLELDRLRRRRYREKHPESVILASRKWREANRERLREADRVRRRNGYVRPPEPDYIARTRWLLKSAVKSGKVVKPKICSGCGAKARLHGHHADYSKPIDVKWLCSICHGLQHRIPLSVLRALGVGEKEERR